MGFGGVRIRPLRLRSSLFSRVVVADYLFNRVEHPSEVHLRFAPGLIRQRITLRPGEGRVSTYFFSDLGSALTTTMQAPAFSPRIR